MRATDKNGGMKKQVSVLMAAFNAEQFIGAAIDSVRTQTYSNWQLIVIDDGSGDGTREVVKSYHDPRILLVESEHLGCQARVLNVGMKHARGEYIAFLDADDLFMPDSLEVRVKYLDEHPGCTAVFGTYVNFGDFKPGKPVRIPEITWENILLPGRVQHQVQAIMVRRETMEAIGGFEDSIEIAGDHILYIKLFLDNFEGVQYISHCVFRYRHTSSGVSRNPEKTGQLLSTLSRNFDWMFRVTDIPIPDKAAMESKVRAAYYGFYCWTRLQSRANGQVRRICQVWERDERVRQEDHVGCTRYRALSVLPFPVGFKLDNLLKRMAALYQTLVSADLSRQGVQKPA